MNLKIVTCIGAYVTLLCMVLSTVLYFAGDHQTSWPYLVLLIVSSWLNGIFWGCRYAAEGRLTWF